MASFKRKLKVRTIYLIPIQRIFNTIINAGYYSEYWEVNGSATTSKYMCLAAGNALYDDAITETEYDIIRNAIDEYLGEEVLLEDKLNAESKPNDFSARLAIYRNWSKRP